MTPLLPAVDWQLAGRLGSSLVRPGTPPARDEIRGVVAELHVAADRAIELVSEATQLGVRPRPPVYAVDRVSWARANTQLADRVFGLVEPQPPPTLRRKVARRANALAVGAGLAALGSRVLGQYDPFHPGGRLLLVVPNILEAERQLSLPVADFRLWATLHEQTHAVQFAAAPWLIDHLVGLVRRVAGYKGVRLSGGVLDEVTAVMSLLEGHADVMMDLAGRDVVPSWGLLRERFSATRAKKSSRSQRLGVVNKAQQYERGAEFCRAVIAEAGVGALNRAFEDERWLPRPDELAAPREWLRRTSG